MSAPDVVPDLDDPLREEQAIARLLALWQARTGGAPGARRPIEESLKNLFSEEDAPTKWLVKGLLPERAVYALAGEAKTTKTWAALEMALAVASGLPAFREFKVPRVGSVLYFFMEDNRRSVRKRARALMAQRCTDDAWKSRIYFRCHESLDVIQDNDLAWIARQVERLRPDVVVFDPMRDIHTGEENDSGDMGDVVKRLRFVRDEFGCAIVFVHHMGKPGENTSKRRPGMRMRGSSALHGGVDGGAYFEPRRQEKTEWENRLLVELKEARGAGAFNLVLRVRDDANGDAEEAVWEYSPGDSKGAQASGGADDKGARDEQTIKELEEQALAVLREHDGPAPLTREHVRGLLRTNRGMVEVVVNRLILAGSIRKVMRGKKAEGIRWAESPFLTPSAPHPAANPEWSGTGAQSHSWQDGGDHDHE